MTPEEIHRSIRYIKDEKGKLEHEIFMKIKEFEEKHDVFVAFIRNVPYIQMNGQERTQDIRLDLTI